MFVSNFYLKHYLQTFLCSFQEIMDFSTVHPASELRRIAAYESATYINEKMPKAVGLYSARRVLDLALDEASVDGHFLEFGVFRGASLRYIARRTPNRTVFGFDSFEGLPDAWSGARREQGAFSRGGRLPRVPANVKLEVGWFDASLPKWLTANPGQVAFMHIDCDIYSSTRTILELIVGRIVPGTIILFDEYLGYPRWRDHEFKAFQEFVAANNAEYEYLAFASYQTAIRVLSINGTKSTVAS